MTRFGTTMPSYTWLIQSNTSLLSVLQLLHVHVLVVECLSALNWRIQSHKLVYVYKLCQSQFWNAIANYICKWWDSHNGRLFSSRLCSATFNMCGSWPGNGKGGKGREIMKTISSKGSTESSTMPTRRYTGSCRSARLQALCNYSCWPEIIKVHCTIWV